MSREKKRNLSGIEPQGWGLITLGRGASILKILERRTGLPTIVRLADGEEIVVYNIAWGRDAGHVWEHVTANISPPCEEHSFHFFFLSEVTALLDPETGRVLIEQKPSPDER